jgi:hypothetical protein
MGTLYGQGYLFHRPMPLWEEVPERIILPSGEPATSGRGGLREAQ